MRTDNKSGNQEPDDAGQTDALAEKANYRGDDRDNGQVLYEINCAHAGTIPKPSVGRLWQAVGKKAIHAAQNQKHISSPDQIGSSLPALLKRRWACYLFRREWTHSKQSDFRR